MLRAGDTDAELPASWPSFQQACSTTCATPSRPAEPGQPRPLERPDLPPALRRPVHRRHRQIPADGYPKEDLWKRENQEAFIEQLGRVDPNVTGTPVQLYQYTALLKDSYGKRRGIRLVAIVILVLLHFRSSLS